MAQITYKGSGAGVSVNGTTALAPAYPATVDANDIAILHVVHRKTDSSNPTPSGWTLITGPDNIGTTPTGRSWTFARIADGTEDGATVTLNTTVTFEKAARIHTFSGYVSGAITDLTASVDKSVHANRCQPPTVTVSDADGAAIWLADQMDNNTAAAPVGATGGTWTEPVAEYSPALTTGLMLATMVATDVAAGGTITGGGTVGSANDEAGTVAFALLPQPAGGTPADVPLATAAAVSAATLALTAPTQVPLDAAAGQSSATLSVTVPGAALVPLDTAAAQSAATLALTATTTVPLGTSAAQSTASLALAAPTRVPLDTAAAQSSATLSLSAQTRIPLGTAAATSTATLALSAPTTVVLGASAAQSAATAFVTAQTYIPLGTSTVQSSATLTVFAPSSTIPMQPSSGVSSATLTFTAKTAVPLDASTAVSTGTLALSAKTVVPLQASVGLSNATMTVFAPTAALLVLGAATATSTATLALVPLGNRWPASTDDHWLVTAGGRWDVDPESNW